MTERAWSGASGGAHAGDMLRTVAAADLYCDIRADPAVRWRDHVAGLIVAAAGTMAAAFLANAYGAPLTLMALLVGLSLNFLGADERLAPGLNLASRTLLRGGIVLLGAQVTFGQIAALGPATLLAVLGIVAAVIGVGMLVARCCGAGMALGALGGGAVAICGASAALALFTVLGERRVSQAQLALVLMGVAVMSAAAMILYPAIAMALDLSDRQAGFLLGGAIHDVAQAIGAGYAFSPDAGRVAVIVKLTRVTLLAPLLLAVSCFVPRGNAAAIRLPWFVTGFFAVAAANSIGMVPAIVASVAKEGASAILAAAVLATGIRTAPRQLRGAPGPLIIVGLASLASLALAVGATIAIIGR